MPIIKVTPPIEPEKSTVSVKVAPPNVPVKVVDDSRHVYEFNLNLRRALNGDLMVFDHADIDIIILTEKKKIVAAARTLFDFQIITATKANMISRNYK